MAIWAGHPGQFSQEGTRELETRTAGTRQDCLDSWPDRSACTGQRGLNGQDITAKTGGYNRAGNKNPGEQDSWDRTA